ncbi:MAG: tetratricopeptide repeat protein, partial [Pseudomonadota bacterium]
MRGFGLSNQWRLPAMVFCTALLLTGCATTAPPPPAEPAASPEAVQRALEYADAALSKGNLAAARKGYRQALTLAPGTKAAQLGLGEIELVAGDPNQALEYFSAVATADPILRPGALPGQGITLMKLDRSEEALPALKEAVTLDPGLWRAWNALGTLEDARHDWAAADEAYGKALAIKPDAAIVLNNIGMSKLVRRDYAAAEQDFARALAMDPDLDETAANRRLAQAWQGRYEVALQGAGTETLPRLLN